MLNIVIPMAGAGSRFAQAGYEDPKPLIQVHGMPMIQVVINNLRPKCEHRFIFVCQKSHSDTYNLRAKLGDWAPGCQIIEIEGLTRGAAETVLRARQLIDNDSPLMIANSDQWVNTDIDIYLSKIEHNDGLIMTMNDNDPKWSYVELGPNGKPIRVVEKKVVSSHATVGIYNFAMGSYFVSAAERMINEENFSNGEFYVAPTYDYLINDGATIAIADVGPVSEVMFGLGIPEDLNSFLNNELSFKATGK